MIVKTKIKPKHHLAAGSVHFLKISCPVVPRSPGLKVIMEIITKIIKSSNDCCTPLTRSEKEVIMKVITKITKFSKL